MTLTPDNYHSLDAQRDHLTNSQWKAWQKCPYATKAWLDGLFVKLDTTDEAAVEAAKAAGKVVRVPTEALLVGSYCDRAVTLSEDALRGWIEAHQADVMKLTGRAPAKVWEKRAKFVEADALIAVVKADPIFQRISAACQQQVVLEGEIHGARWAYMADWLDPDPAHPCLMDFKTAASFADDWTEEERLEDGEWRTIRLMAPWYDAAGYWRQLAIGRELYRQTYGVAPRCGIAAITKQDPPARGLWELPDESPRWARELYAISLRLPDVLAWKSGAAPIVLRDDRDRPQDACGDCEWCRSQTAWSPQRQGRSGRMWTVD